MKARRIFKSEPRLLCFDAAFLHEALRAENVPVDTVRAESRQPRAAELRARHAVVLETNGSLSVLPRRESGAAEAPGGLHDC